MGILISSATKLMKKLCKLRVEKSVKSWKILVFIHQIECCLFLTFQNGIHGADKTVKKIALSHLKQSSFLVIGRSTSGFPGCKTECVLAGHATI